MNTASLSEIKKELKHLPGEQVLALCLNLSKFKKENKEFMSYLLFESHDEHSFVEKVKKEVDDQFMNLNTGQIYLAKKTLRKVLRTINRYIRFSSSKQTEADLLIYYCFKLKRSGIVLSKYPVIWNLYQNQFSKIESAVAKLHEDLQYDYHKELADLL